MNSGTRDNFGRILREQEADLPFLVELHEQVLAAHATTTDPTVRLVFRAMRQAVEDRIAELDV